MTSDWHSHVLVISLHYHLMCIKQEKFEMDVTITGASNESLICGTGKQSF